MPSKAAILALIGTAMGGQIFFYSPIFADEEPGSGASEKM
jgi:hypothetical protein